MPREAEDPEQRLARAEALLEEIQQSAHVGTWEWDVATGAVTWSDEMYRLLGYEPGANATGFEAYLDRVHPEDRDRVHEAVEAASRSGERFAFEHRVVWPDGTVRSLQVRGRVIRDSEGAPACLFGTSQDITDRKQIEQELRDVAAAQRFLAEASTVLDVWLDDEQTLTNLARLAVPRIADWCAIDMLQEDGSIHRVVTMHYDPRRLEEVQRSGLSYVARLDDPAGIGRVIREGRSTLAQTITDDMLTALTRDAEQLRLLRGLGLRSVMVVPLTARGRTLGAISLVVAESGRQYGPTDLAVAESLAHRAALALDNVRLYRAEQAARAEAEAALRSRDAFIAMVSHDLRNPLTVLKGSAQFIQRDQGSSERLLASIIRQADLLERLIDDLADAARLANEPPTVRFATLDLVAEVGAAVRQAQTQTASHTIRVVAPTAPLRGNWDRDRLSQIFQNLLTNAIKYSPGGGEIVVQVADLGDAAQVTVTDPGVGIAAEDLPRVFERFFRAHDEATSGLGLGLFIVRSLVEAHGGRVWVQSEGPGRGSTFGIALPYAPPAPAAATLKKRRRRRRS